MLRPAFDLQPRASIIAIVRRLWPLTNATGADGRVRAWFGSNLRWEHAGGIVASTEDVGAFDPGLAASDARGELLVCGDLNPEYPYPSNYPALDSQNAYARLYTAVAFSARPRVLVASIPWSDYSSITTAMRFIGPTVQSGDFDAALAAT